MLEHIQTDKLWMGLPRSRMILPNSSTVDDSNKYVVMCGISMWVVMIGTCIVIQLRMVEWLREINISNALVVRIDLSRVCVVQLTPVHFFISL